ncbi:MAG: aminoacetone oxidase family FAD-binding enzyme [Anaerococcus sp.]|nr:aminoacetone oxidase family FAD-binding enzyme [Anaerococcus sp.]
MKKIAIIGAGPAGIFASINIKNKNNQVYLIDKNDKIGRKLSITGNSRCNITNARIYDDFLDHIIRNKEFLYSSFSKFDNFSMMDFLNKNGLETLIEDDFRVFPKSMKASDVISLFERLIEEKGVKFLAKTKVKSINKDKNFTLITNKGRLYFDILIIATGGLSYENTGSSGDGYKFAKNFNHTIIKPRPSLAPIYFKENLNIKALSLKEVGLTGFFSGGKISEIGDILLTRKFITGPISLRLQARLAREGIDKISLDFFPKKDLKDLDQILINLIDQSPKKSISNVLKGIMNENLVYSILERCLISKDKKANQVSKKERSSILRLIKDFKLTYDKNAGFRAAIVTSGGVSTDEVNPKTMESRLVENLYFIGEVLDLDGLTGGFNLQIAFTSAYGASLAIKEKL